MAEQAQTIADAQAAAAAPGVEPGIVQIDHDRVAEMVAVSIGVMNALGSAPAQAPPPPAAPTQGAAATQVVLPSIAVKFPLFTGDDAPNESRATCWAAVVESTIERLEGYFECYPTQFANDRQKLLALNLLRTSGGSIRVAAVMSRRLTSLRPLSAIISLQLRVNSRVTPTDFCSFVSVKRTR